MSKPDELQCPAWPSEPIDFSAAAGFLELARNAHAARDLAGFIAARKMVAIALMVEPEAPPQPIVRRVR